MQMRLCGVPGTNRQMWLNAKHSSLCSNMRVVCKFVMLMPCVLTPLSPLCLQGQSVVLVGHPS